MIRIVVLDEDLGIVDIAVRVEQRRRGRNRTLERERIDGDLVPGTELTVADALKGRPGVDEREVDVEEDGAGRHGWHARAVRVCHGRVIRAIRG